MKELKSVGTLYSVQDLCEELAQRSILKDEFVKGFRAKYASSTSTATLELGTELGWIATSTDGLLVVTARGKEAIAGTSRAEKLRNQLKSFIFEVKPFWASRIPLGRKETEPYLGSEMKQCFKEANLMGDLDDTVIKWWDEVGIVFRRLSDERKLDTGRQGEQLTLEYEERRTKNKPKWQSVETNLSGFDVLSRVNDVDSTKLKIEVKASTLPEDSALFHVSRNEWAVATNSPNTYLFHLWLLCQQPPKLITATVELVSPHVPQNSGFGSWESVEIPIKVLAS